MYRLLGLLSTGCLVVVACSGGGGGSKDTPGGCQPSCDGKACGSDGCGGSCGECGEGLVCGEESACIPDPECQASCEGRECGSDGCGGSCGECGEGLVCNPYLGRCAGGCARNCDGKACGDDGCGGSCGACKDGETCAAGKCLKENLCTDGEKDGDETDVDCGGSCAAKCAVGAGCATGADCTSGQCDGKACAGASTCGNGQKDGQETDADCGGPSCPKCAVNKNCSGNGDCLSDSCIYGVCAMPNCTDSFKNGQETDVDCGGPTCKKCENGSTCKKSSDCSGELCDGGTCCTKNACGACGAAPKEVCDGKDNDCDGQTDEWGEIGEAPLCPKQNGYCKGARSVCQGGWKCPLESYLDVFSEYDTVDRPCDDLDNDCDGKTDFPGCDPGMACGDHACECLPPYSKCESGAVWKCYNDSGLMKEEVGVEEPLGWHKVSLCAQGCAADGVRCKVTGTACWLLDQCTGETWCDTKVCYDTGGAITYPGNGSSPRCGFACQSPAWCLANGGVTCHDTFDSDFCHCVDPTD